MEVKVSLIYRSSLQDLHSVHINFNIVFLEKLCCGSWLVSGGIVYPKKLYINC